MARVTGTSVIRHPDSEKHWIQASPDALISDTTGKVIKVIEVRHIRMDVDFSVET